MPFKIIIWIMSAAGSGTNRARLTGRGPDVGTDLSCPW